MSGQELNAIALSNLTLSIDIQTFIARMGDMEKLSNYQSSALGQNGLELIAQLALGVVLLGIIAVVVVVASQFLTSFRTKAREIQTAVDGFGR